MGVKIKAELSDTRLGFAIIIIMLVLLCCSATYFGLKNRAQCCKRGKSEAPAIPISGDSAADSNIQNDGVASAAIPEDDDDDAKV